MIDPEEVQGWTTRCELELWMVVIFLGLSGLLALILIVK